MEENDTSNADELEKEPVEDSVTEPTVVQPVEEVQERKTVVVVAQEPEPYLYHALRTPRAARMRYGLKGDYGRVYNAIWASPNITIDQISRATKMHPEDVNNVLNYCQNRGLIKVAQKPVEADKILVINVSPTRRYSDEYARIKDNANKGNDYLHRYSRVSIA